MGRPGQQLLSWTDLTIGQLVYFFTGAGWKKATVLSTTDHSAKVLFIQGNNERQISITDQRNIRTKDDTDGAHVQSVGDPSFNGRHQESFDLGL
jgi:hypothetical protein